jgi:hypothetical protein
MFPHYDSGRYAVNELTLWSELSRREQRIVIKLFGGGSVSGENEEATANLMRLDLITEAGLTARGLKLFISAFKAQQDARRREMFA